MGSRDAACAPTTGRRSSSGARLAPGAARRRRRDPGRRQRAADDATRTLVTSGSPASATVGAGAGARLRPQSGARAGATGDVVAFLDDDAVAAENWTGALAAVFEADPKVAVCTAGSKPLGRDTEGERLFEANGGFSRGLGRIRLPADAGRPLHGRPAPLIAWAVSVGSGCSYAVRPDVALGLGGFDEALDLGAALPGGGDHDLLWRALEAGHSVVYEPAALAWHEHRAAAAAVARPDRRAPARAARLPQQAPRARRRGPRRPLAGYLAWRLLKPGRPPGASRVRPRSAAGPRPGAHVVELLGGPGAPIRARVGSRGHAGRRRHGEPAPSRTRPRAARLRRSGATGSCSAAWWSGTSR